MYVLSLNCLSWILMYQYMYVFYSVQYKHFIIVVIYGCTYSLYINTRYILSYLLVLSIRQW